MKRSYQFVLTAQIDRRTNYLRDYINYDLWILIWNELLMNPIRRLDTPLKGEIHETD